MGSRPGALFGANFRLTFNPLFWFNVFLFNWGFFQRSELLDLDKCSKFINKLLGSLLGYPSLGLHNCLSNNQPGIVNTMRLVL